MNGLVEVLIVDHGEAMRGYAEYAVAIVSTRNASEAYNATPVNVKERWRAYNMRIRVTWLQIVMAAIIRRI